MGGPKEGRWGIVVMALKGPFGYACSHVRGGCFCCCSCSSSSTVESLVGVMGNDERFKEKSGSKVRGEELAIGSIEAMVAVEVGCVLVAETYL